MPNYQAMIFDLDGTLVDTLRDIAESVNQALKKLNLDTHPVESFRLKVGNGSRVLAARSLGPDQQHLVDKLYEIQQAYYAKHFCDFSKPYPDIIQTLTQLRRQGLKLAVLSNKPDHFTRKLVQHFFDDSLFDIVRGQLPETPLKPDPAAALTICEQLGMNSKNVAFIGDSGVDMQTARNASLYAIGVAWGFRSPEELQKNGCQKVIQKPSELLELL